MQLARLMCSTCDMAVSAPHSAPPEGTQENIKRQYLWDTPDGNLPNFSETFIYGADVRFSWNALNHSIYDLWLTSWDFDSSPMALCLASGCMRPEPLCRPELLTRRDSGAVNLAHDGCVDLDTSETPPQLANGTRYVLRFKPPTAQHQFVVSEPDLSSPAFFILTGLTDASAQPGTVTSPAPEASTTESVVRSSTYIREIATTSVLGSGARKAGTMSPGGAAALMIGLIMFVCFFVALGVTLLWRKTRRRHRERRWPGLGNHSQFAQVGEAELPTNSPWMSPELPGDSEWGQRVHELQGGGPGMETRSRNEAPRPTIAMDDSLVELEAASDDPPTGHAPACRRTEER